MINRKAAAKASAVASPPQPVALAARRRQRRFRLPLLTLPHSWTRLLSATQHSEWSLYLALVCSILALTAIVQNAAVFSRGGAVDVDPAFEPFGRWLHLGGVRMQGITLDRHRTVRAARALDSRELVLRVPNSRLINEAVARGNPISVALSGANIALHPHSDFALFLLAERAKGVSSDWYHYLSVLPTDYSHMPINFSNDTLSLLQGSLLQTGITDQQDTLWTDYQRLMEFDSSLSGTITVSDWQWARSVVRTRLFGVTLDGDDDRVLAPMADLINHGPDNEVNVRWQYDDSLQSFTMTTIRPINGSAELIDSYGSRSNEQLALSYGFALYDNPHDQAILAFSLNATDLMAEWKSHTLQRSKFPVRDYRTRFSKQYKGHSKTESLFSYLRFLVADVKDLQTMFKTYGIQGINVVDIQPLTLDNEVRVLGTIHAATVASLSRFSSTLVEDERLLSDYGLFPLGSNDRTCLLVRHGEKLVLAWWQHFVHQSLAFVDETVRLGSVRNESLIQALFASPDLSEYYNTVLTALIKKERGRVEIAGAKPLTVPTLQQVDPLAVDLTAASAAIDRIDATVAASRGSVHDTVSEQRASVAKLERQLAELQAKMQAMKLPERL